MLPEIKPGCAGEIPNTSINAVKPDPPPLGSWNAVFTESSWCLDPATGIFYLALSGGHADSSNNATFAWNSRTDQKWFVQHPGSPVSIHPPAGDKQETYPDGLPASRHTRDGQEFIQRLGNKGSIYQHAGSLWKHGGNSYRTWSQDIETKIWRQMAPAPDGQFTNAYCALDEATDSVLVARALTSGPLRLYRHFYLTDTWQKLNDSPHVEHRKTLTYDPNTKTLVLVGLGQVIKWDLNQPSKPAVIALTNLSARWSELGRVGWGCEYDPELKKFVIWPQGHRILFLDPLTMEMTEHQWPAENTVRLPDQPGGATSGLTGPHGRFRRDPVTGLYFILNSVPQNIFVWRAPNLSGGQMNVTVVINPVITEFNPADLPPGETGGKWRIELIDGPDPRTVEGGNKTVTFNGVAAGTYTAKAQRLDSLGGPLGIEGTFGPFEVKADVVITIKIETVGTITAQVIQA